MYPSIILQYYKRKSILSYIFTNPLSIITTFSHCTLPDNFSQRHFTCIIFDSYGNSLIILAIFLIVAIVVSLIVKILISKTREMLEKVEGVRVGKGAKRIVTGGDSQRYIVKQTYIGRFNQAQMNSQNPKATASKAIDNHDETTSTSHKYSGYPAVMYNIDSQNFTLKSKQKSSLQLAKPPTTTSNKVKKKSSLLWVIKLLKKSRRKKTLLKLLQRKKFLSKD